MILTCPECATRYFVREGSIPDGGRKVRCAGCGHMWHADASDLTLDLNSLADDDIYGEEFRAAPSESAQPEPEPTLPTRIRAQVQAQKKTREAVAAGVVWAVLCAGFALVLVAAVLFRVQVVRMFPATAGAYAAVKLPVNPTGLSLENVQGGPGLTNGRATLVVSGVERNVETDARSPAPVHVALFDKAGKRIVDQIGPVEGPPLAPGETRAFSVNIFDPPINISEFQVEFVVEPDKPAKAKAAGHHPAGANRKAVLPLRGAVGEPGLAAVKAPEVARPLPANSPYALPTETKLRGEAQ